MFTKTIKLKNGVQQKLIVAESPFGIQNFPVSLLRKTNGAIVIFDLTDRSTYLKVDNWINLLKEKGDKDI